MSEPSQPVQELKRPLLWGRFSGLVLSIVAIGVLLDQVSKHWLLSVYDIASAGAFKFIPTIDIVLVWNRGISYGLFQQDSDWGRWGLVVITIIAAVALWIWSTRVTTKALAFSLALIIGGAIGNGIDRLVFGAVFDFIHFHVGDFSWYVFNLADVWIVAGVVGLLYDSFRNGPNSAAK